MYLTAASASPAAKASEMLASDDPWATATTFTPFPPNAPKMRAAMPGFHTPADDSHNHDVRLDSDPVNQAAANLTGEGLLQSLRDLGRIPFGHDEADALLR